MSVMSIAVFISGRGTNLQALIDAKARGKLTVSIDVVVSNNPAAPGLEWARAAGIDVVIVDHRLSDSREHFDQALLDAIAPYNVDYIILAGFMRRLTPLFVAAYQGKIVNIHPSLLPKYKGLNTFRRAIKNKEKLSGCSVHYVNKKLDSGKVILQKKVIISKNDTESSLKKKIQKEEYRAYSEAIRKVFSNTSS